MKHWIIRIGAMIIALIGVVAAIGISGLGFQQVLDFRELERIPLTEIMSSVGGESHVRGKAMQRDRTVLAPKTGKKALYYYYTKEKKETDSDGNTRWRTVDQQSDAVAFDLVDSSGSALIEAAIYRNRVDWSIGISYQREQLGYRYTEWRIDPGAEIELFGWLSYEPNPVITFPFQGQYQPIVTSTDAETEQASIAFEAIALLWGGVTAMILACLALIYGLQQHKTVVLLALVTFAGTILLLDLGYRSVVNDVNEGYERVRTYQDRATELINSRLQTYELMPMPLSSGFDTSSVIYSDLSETDKERINAWRRGAYLVLDRYQQQIDRFPESYMAARLGLDAPSPVKLPADQLKLAQAEAADYVQTSTRVSPLWSLLLLALTFAAAWFSFKVIRVKRMQENIPTSKTEGVVYGIAEVKGELVPDDYDEVLEGPLTGEPCVWFRYLVQEKQGSGKNQSWVTIKDQIGKQPFYCEDDEGRIRVFPTKAECITEHIDNDHVGRRRYTEWRLMPGDQLYILGRAKPDRTRGDTLVFSHDTKHGESPFIIANISEAAVMMRKAMQGMSLLCGALSLLFFGALIIIGSSGQMSSLDFLLASLVAPVFMLFVVFVLMYNDLIFLRQRCDRNWANIQVSLKKRADLIPQLQSVVVEYLSHEKSLQTELTRLRELRNEVNGSADVDRYLEQEHAVIGEIAARIEDYPDLEGIDLVAVFNRRLIKLENEIALMRAGFNDAVNEYEIRRQSFPDLFIAKLGRFSALDPLGFDQAAHEVPQVAPIAV